jgi:uncharacterized protein HemX
MRVRNQSGFGHVVLLVLLVAVAVIGFAGYRVWTARNSSTTDTSVSSAIKVPTTITSKADLIQTSKSLDASAVQLNNSLDASVLDSDVNSML